MKRSRRRSPSSPVTLFPFLAVLVSTMGALILLLLSISRQVSAQNLAAALAHILDRVRADEQSLASRRDALTEQIAAIEQRITAAQREGRSVDQTLLHHDQRSRSRQAGLLASQRELEQSRRRRREIAREWTDLQRRLATMETNVQRLNAVERDSDNSFVPVVHPGSNGTVRHPIFIECTRDGVILQPEAVAIPLPMLDAEVPGENALARAVRALSAYHTRRLQPDVGEQTASVTAAYPLLLVRPDGVRPFYAARQSLEETALPFGYELLEASWSLQFPDPDPEARALAIAAIQRARYDAHGRSQVVSDLGMPPRRLAPTPGTLAPGAPAPGAPAPGTAASGTVAPGTVAPGRESVLPLPPSAGGEGQGERGEVAGDALEKTLTPVLSPQAGRGRSVDAIAQARRGRSIDAIAQAGRGRSADGHSAHVGVRVDADSSDPVSVASTDERADAVDSMIQGESAQLSDAQDQPPRDTSDATSSETAPGDHAHVASRTTSASESATSSDGDGPIGWQLPGSESSGRRIPIARRVEIVCASDYLVVGSAGAVVHLDGRRMAEVAARLTEEIEREVRGWGPPGSMFWWRPELRFHVRPDAIENYYRIRIALAGSSAAVSHEIVWDDRPDAVPGDFLGRATEPAGLARQMADRFWE